MAFKTTIAFFCTLLIVLSGCVQNEQDTFGLALSVSPASTVPYIAYQQGFMEEEDINVNFQSNIAGRVNLEALLGGTADFAAVSDIGTTLAILQNQDIYLIATIIQSNEHLYLVGRKDRGITEPQDIKGKKVAVFLGTSAEFTLDKLLERNGLGRNDVTIVNLRPQDTIVALVRGDIDAALLWQPNVYLVQKELQENVITFDAQDFPFMFFIAVKREFAEKHPEEIKKVLRSLIKSEKFIKENREESIQIMSDYTDIPVEDFEQIWDRYDYSISLDSSIIDLLNEQADWAIANGLSKAVEKPNFKEILYYEPLKEISPDKVTID